MGGIIYGNIKTVNKLKKIIACILVVSIMIVTGCAKEEDMYSKDNIGYVSPTVFMQFFDWFEEESWVEESFVDQIDWEALDIHGDDRSSEEFYYKMFSYIKSLGVDALAWEFHPRKGVDSLYPSENAIKALQRSGLKIACFYDYEVAVKVRDEDILIATLSQNGSINASQEVIDNMLLDINEFYDHVPQDLLAYDKDGKQVIYIYGYDFDDSNIDIAAWDHFADALIQGTKKKANNDTRIYWTSKYSVFEEHLFQHYSDQIVPFQFVLDTPQSQYSNKSVTWNLGYDNLGVQERDNLQRVIRLDERYVKEMGWLSKATDASAIFIYSWNEPFEGSMAIPTEEWGNTKATLVKEYIKRLKTGNDRILKKTILIVDDFDKYINDENEWHYALEREMLLYTMRRMVPQSDVYMVDSVSKDLLDKYECIIDLSFDKSAELSSWLVEMKDNKQIVFFDSKAGITDCTYTDLFLKDRQYVSVNRELPIHEMGKTVFVRDDMVLGKLTDGSKSICDVELGENSIPIIVQKDDDIWTSSYANNETIMKLIFEAFYETELPLSIMYGEGLAAQRLEIDPNTHEINKNTLEKYSINQYWDIPKKVNWRVMPDKIDKSYFNFIFGLE